MVGDLPRPATRFSPYRRRPAFLHARFNPVSIIPYAGPTANVLAIRHRMTHGGPSSTLKLWNTSCPELSLTVTSTSSSDSACLAGTFQVTSPLSETARPSGPDSSLNFTPPFLERTSSLYEKAVPGLAVGGRDTTTR